MNDLGQRFPGDLQWLSCSPGSCGMPKSSWSTSQRKTLLLLLLPYCPLLAVRISSVYTFCLIRKSSLSEILHWRMYPPIKVSFPLKSSHHLTAPNPHFSCMSQMEKKGRRWFVFFFFQGKSGCVSDTQQDIEIYAWPPRGIQKLRHDPTYSKCSVFA